MTQPRDKQHIPPLWEDLPTYDISDEKASLERQKERVMLMAQRVLELIRTKKVKFPMLPQTATDALQLASNTQASMREIEQVIATDQLLAARVLAVANSSAYGSLNVRTLNQALQRLGTGTIRDIVFQAVAESHIFRGSEGRSLRAEREHSVAVAHISREICKILRIDSEYAFVCGLLHDIGRTLMMDMLSRSSEEEVTRVERVLLLHKTHPLVGANLARAWKLPAMVVESCRRHHNYRNFKKRTGYSQIGNLVAAADRIAEHHGAGRNVVPVDLNTDRCFFDLGLTVPQIEQLIEDTIILAA